jgi:nucleoside-diphosphate-sugar epimerase
MDSPHLLVFGLGYSGTAVARSAAALGWRVTGTTRSPLGAAPDGVAVVPFTEAAAVLADVTLCLATAAPDAAADPVLARYEPALRVAPRLRWIGYLSTTGVYGNRDGGWVDETSAPAPGSTRTRGRVAAEQAWAALASRCAVDVFRLAGIYGPGRSQFDALRAGMARRILKPGHAFSRIHRDDIAGAVMAAMRQQHAPGLRVFNVADDVPSEPAVVIEEAARLLGIDPPPAVPFDAVRAAMSPMALSFWAENRKVSSRATQHALGYAWRYPSYREGLRAILAEETATTG